MPLKKRPVFRPPPVEEKSDDSSDHSEDYESDGAENDDSDDNDDGFSDQNDDESEDEDGSDEPDDFDDMEEIPHDISQPRDIPERTDVGGEPPSKKKRPDLTKPPTTQELNAMKETENLFHSNIFKLQTQEMLTEIQVKESRKNKINEWIEKLKAAIGGIQETKAKHLADTSDLDAAGVKCPFTQAAGNDEKNKFAFKQPESINVIGSWALELATRVDPTVDLLIIMPPACLKKEDYKDYRYHRKRALYLAHVAASLKSNPLVASLQFTATDLDRPILLLEPSGKLNGRVRIRVMVAPPADFFPAERLRSDQSCIGDKACAQYSTGILADQSALAIHSDTQLPLSTMKNVKSACLLLRVWARQRQMDAAGGWFILSQFVRYLIEQKKIRDGTSSYQVLRSVWLHLARSDWTSQGIRLGQSSDSSVADSHAHSAVVFLDASGSLNYCARMASATFEWWRWEAHLAVGLLNQTSSNSFASLFITPKPFVLGFDNVLMVRDAKEETAEQMRRVLTRGLGNRLKLLAANPLPLESWQVNCVPERRRKLVVGFIWNAPAAWEVLDKGPASDSAESEEFRRFWGKKSELRRFQDGFVCEAVLWPAANWSERRLICKQIISYLLFQQLNLSDYHYVADQLDRVLSIPKLEHADVYGTGEEAAQKAVEASDSLTKNLRNLEELPLVITQIQSIAPTLRHAEPFPPLPDIPQGSYKMLDRAAGTLRPTKEMTPLFQPSMTLVLTLETSGKWPDDYEAVRRIKAAFYIQLAERWSRQYQTTAKAFADHVLILHCGFVFKLIIGYQREVALLKREVTEGGLVKYRDNPQSLQLGKVINILPRVSSALRGLQAEQPAFSAAVRMAKRWIAAQMLLDYVPEEAVELMVASLFVDSGMYGHVVAFQSSVVASNPSAAASAAKCSVDWVGSSNPQVAFLRFLQLVAYRDWHNQPLFINFNGQMSAEELREADASIAGRRAQLPALVLVTPFDPSGVAFTCQNPPVAVWSRLMVLAVESLKLLERQLVDGVGDVLQSFRPPLDHYDVVIHLKRGLVARRLNTLDAPSDKKIRKFDAAEAEDPKKKKKALNLPVVDYEPVDRLLSELRAAHGQRARFFRDTYGGVQIGVAWIDKAWTPQPFKVSGVAGCCLDDADGERLVPHLEAICQDFLILGRGLVSSVQTKSFTWQAEQTVSR